MLEDGRAGHVVLVADRRKFRGAVVLGAPENGQVAEPIPLLQYLDSLSAQQVIDILCMQERAFGDSGLDAPTNP